MPSRSRRDFLRSTPAVAALLTGCTSPETATDRPTTDATTGPDPSAITPSASIVSQGSAYSPPIAELGLTNEGDRPVPVTPNGEEGLPMEHLGPLRGSEGQAILFPTVPNHVFVHGGSLPGEPDEGCWRFPQAEGDDDVLVAVEALEFEATVDPGETYTRRHRVYYDGADGCFPSSTYETTTQLSLSEQMADGPTFTLTYSLDATDPSDLALSVEKRGAD